MVVQYVNGDIFINRFNAQAVAHGCNIQGVMGAGIAVQFKKRYPEMFKVYRQMCQEQCITVGDCFWWEEKDKPIVFNLMTQPDCGGATYDGIRESLLEMRKIATKKPRITSIAMPKIGAGLGGLNWEIIKCLIEKVFDGWNGILYIYEEYIPNC